MPMPDRPCMATSTTMRSGIRASASLSASEPCRRFARSSRRLAGRRQERLLTAANHPRQSRGQAPVLKAPALPKVASSGHSRLSKSGFIGLLRYWRAEIGALPTVSATIGRGAATAAAKAPVQKLQGRREDSEYRAGEAETGDQQSSALNISKVTI